MTSNNIVLPHSVLMHAVCVFIDVRGFTPLTTILDRNDLSDILEAIRKECFSLKNNRPSARLEWHPEAQKRCSDRKKELISEYNRGRSSQLFPYGVSKRMIQGLSFPLIAFYKFLGDGIMFVFEVTSPQERYYLDSIADKFQIKDDGQKNRNKTELLKCIIRWLTELSRWRPDEEWESSSRAAGRVRDLRLGIGVSYGSVLREVAVDPYDDTERVVIDYVGDPLNRASRLQSNAVSGGAVFDVSNSEFRSLLKETWLEMSLSDAYDTNQPYYFAQYPDRIDIKGVGRMSAWACGDVGRDLLYKSDTIEVNSRSSHELPDIKMIIQKNKDKIIPEETYCIYGHDAVRPFGILIDDMALPGSEKNEPQIEMVMPPRNYRETMRELLGPERFAQWQSLMIAKKRIDPKIFDGDVVRLERFTPGRIAASDSGYLWAGGTQFSFTQKIVTSPFWTYELLSQPFTYSDQYKNGEKSAETDLARSVLGNHIGVDTILYWHESLEKDTRVTVLLQLRSADVLVMRNTWCPSGSGTLVPGEQLSEGASRELQRETGIKFASQRFTYLGIVREISRFGAPDAFFACATSRKEIEGQLPLIEQEEVVEKDEVNKIYLCTFKWDDSNTLFSVADMSEIKDGHIDDLAGPELDAIRKQFYSTMSESAKIIIYLLFRKLKSDKQGHH